MGSTRRAVFITALTTALCVAEAQPPEEQDRNHQPPFPPKENEDPKLPNGKSQKDAMAKQEHEQALKDTKDLIATAEQLRDELSKDGTFVVSMSSLKKTEDIEKLARRIRSRLKA
jgi:cell division septation protein DedD